jgi:hypothetical protein
MNWNYQIIKDGKEYFLAEVLDGESWCEVEDTRASSIKELLEDLYNRYADANRYPVLEIQKDKLVRYYE